MKRLSLFVALVAVLAYVGWRIGYLPLPAALTGARQTTAQTDGPRGGGPGRGGEGAPVVITASEARTADVPVTLDAIGTVQALKTVTVRPQVDGKLIEVDFKEGQDVKAGDVLARIDPVTYQAQYDQAVAKKAQDEAQLANARIDLERYAKLAVGNFGTKQQADTQRALVAQLTAQIRQDAASVENAKAVLDYTTIRAPIDGRTGLRMVDPGNIVQASTSSGIVVITQIKPIAVVFSMAQQHLRAINAALAKRPLDARALESDNSTTIERGQVSVVDNQVDPTTGTVKIKAEFPNAGIALWPGQFVNVRLTVDTLNNATVVASLAVQRGPNGAYVYVVKDDASVAQTPVEISLQNDRYAVVKSGVAPGMQVATSGFARLRDGAKVRVVPGGGQPTEAARDAAATSPAAAPSRPKGERPRERGAGRPQATQ